MTALNPVVPEHRCDATMLPDSEAAWVHWLGTCQGCFDYCYGNGFAKDTIWAGGVGRSRKIWECEFGDLHCFWATILAIVFNLIIRKSVHSLLSFNNNYLLV